MVGNVDLPDLRAALALSTPGIACTGSIFDDPGVDAGRVLAPVSEDDDLLDEMLS